MFVRSIVDSKQIKQIITASPTDTVAEAVALLTRHRIGAVIVSRDGASLDGILSERDVVRALATIGVSCLDKQVQDLMTREVVGCKIDETATSVLQSMTRGRFRHMPVLEDGRVVGIISIGDVVKARMDEIEHENTALTEMISNAW